MIKLKKLILYLSPGHQCSEYVPWLINHSPDMTHGQTYDANEFGTLYESSWGTGWEPLESQWTLNNKQLFDTRETPDNTKEHRIWRKLYALYKHNRHASDSFPDEFFSLFCYLWKEDNGTRCLFFNVSSPLDYEKWLTECREWFEKNHPEITIVLVGHTMNLSELQYPSVYFLKEGYVFDEHNMFRQDFVSSDIDDGTMQKTLRSKIIGRNQELSNIYKSLSFDFVFSLTDLEDRNNLIDILSQIVTVPKNINELTDFYWDRNPIDNEVDEKMKKMLKSL